MGYNPNGPAAGKQDGLIADDEMEAGRVDPEEKPEDKLHEAREFLRQEVDGNRLGLQRDVEVVRRTLDLLETKVRRGSGAARKPKK